MVFFGVSDLWFILRNVHGAFYGFFVGSHPFSVYFPAWAVEVPVLLVMALAGTLMLSVYCVRHIETPRVDNKEHAAFLVTALGFVYLVVGAWPLWSQGYYWPWQKTIASYGNLLVLPLYAVSLFAFVAGTFSLYKYSRIYHQQYPETPTAFAS